VSPPTTPLRRCPSCGTAIACGVLACPGCGADAPTEIAAAGTIAFALPGGGQEGRRDAVQAALGESFEVRRLLGRGGFGEVWETFDLRLGRAVAVKVLREDLAASATFRERFRRETRAVAKMRHPGIVPVYHVGEDEGLVYFIMPLVEGVTLKTALEQEGRLATAEAVRILTEASDALREAHRRGIVHRDLKPENVMLEGPERRVLLMDFGIAQSEEGDRELTGAGLVLGSPDYMSPEQAMGSRQLDGRSDIYSLGVVGYRMLAGRLPFTAQTAREALAHHVTTPPEPLEAVAEVPGGVASAVMRCLAKRPEERFQTTDELLAALRPTVRYASTPAMPAPAVHETTPLAVTPAIPVAPVPPRRARRRLLAAVVVAGALAGVWLASRWSERRRWDGAAASVEAVFRQVTDSLRVLAAAFDGGSITAPEYLAASNDVQQVAETRITQSFGGILDDPEVMPSVPRSRVEEAMRRAWAAALPGGALAVQGAGAAGCITREEAGALVLEDSSAGDNCWWTMAASPAMVPPIEYVLSFRVPTELRRDAGAGLAWCPAADACRVIFTWSQGRVESADFQPGVGLRRRLISERLPPISGPQHLRVRVDRDSVRAWLGDALVLRHASAGEAHTLAQAGSLRVVVQNAAIAVRPEPLVVVGMRP